MGVAIEQLYGNAFVAFLFAVAEVILRYDVLKRPRKSGEGLR